MKIGGQHFSTAILERIQSTSGEPISRRALSRQVCDWLDWRTPSGKLKEMSCRKALSQMQKQGLITFPQTEKAWAFTHSSPNSLEVAIPEFQGSLSDLGEVQVYPVQSRRTRESKIWRALLDNHHYLGSGPLCGAQIRYLVKCDRGYLGALSFSSATFALACRDHYIGWMENARRAHLDQVVCNSRFLILPKVDVPNLASHVLSLALSRLAADWQQRYQVPPLLVETFVGADRDGTSYKAANFTYVGESAGRRDGQPKRVYLYPLDRRWRQALCTEPETPFPRPESPQDWVEEEFGTIRLYDERLKRRLYAVVRDFYNSPQANIPEVCGGAKARMMGAYRFFRNPKVSMNIILNAHTEATIERIQKEKIVLCPQDTTTLNYSTHWLTGGLGPIGKGENSWGLLLHDTLAFTEKGTPLGILQGQCWARDPEPRRKSRRVKEAPPEQKESVKWLKSFRKVSQIQKQCPQTLLVSIGDREADIYELFQEATKNGAPKLLVRSMRGRQRKTEQKPLWDYLRQQEIAVSQQVHIPRRGRQFERDTWLDIRFAKVTLQPPQGYTNPITVWAVYALENAKFVPPKVKPVEWLLLTTMEVTNAEEAIKIVSWYTKRWGIEVYHKTLKSGCGMEDRQLSEAERLEVCLGLDMVVAWRVDYLKMLGREKPDLPCTVFFEDTEWKSLYYLVKKTPLLPPQPPTIYQAMIMVASKGGFLGRKGDGFPGTKTIWRGLVKLDVAAEMFDFMNHNFYLYPMHSGP